MLQKILSYALFLYLLTIMPGLMAGCMHWGISKCEGRIVSSIEDKETRELVRQGSSVTKSGLRTVMNLRRQASRAVQNAIFD